MGIGKELVVQTHAGRGDNVARDKIVNYRTVDDASTNFGEIVEDIRGTINRILVINKTLIGVSFDIGYEDLESKYEIILNEISELSSNLDGQPIEKSLRELELKNDQINKDSAIINAVFAKIVYNSIHTKKIITSNIKKIGHKDLKEEALTLLQGVDYIEGVLDLEKLGENDFKVLSDEAVKTISLLDITEKVSIKIKVLLEEDNIKKYKTTKFVVSTLAIILILLTIAFSLLAYFTNVENNDLSQLVIPIINIPLPVIFWGFLGSVASMIYRFNKRPIHDFGNSVKWLVTRPFQGIVLSSALYLVLISGQFLFTGQVENIEQGILNSTEIILFISFLVGFSDRFNEGVFNMLIDKYGATTDKSDKNLTDKDQD